MSRSRRTSVVASVVTFAIVGAVGSPLDTRAGTSCTATADALANGGFEEPVIGPTTYALLDATAVPPWLTTDVVNQIELWSDGFDGVQHDQRRRWVMHHIEEWHGPKCHLPADMRLADPQEDREVGNDAEHQKRSEPQAVLARQRNGVDGDGEPGDEPEVPAAKSPALAIRG